MVSAPLRRHPLACLFCLFTYIVSLFQLFHLWPHFAGKGKAKDAGHSIIKETVTALLRRCALAECKLESVCPALPTCWLSGGARRLLPSWVRFAWVERRLARELSLSQLSYPSHNSPAPRLACNPRMCSLEAPFQESADATAYIGRLEATGPEVAQWLADKGPAALSCIIPLPSDAADAAASSSVGGGTAAASAASQAGRTEAAAVAATTTSGEAGAQVATGGQAAAAAAAAAAAVAGLHISSSVGGRGRSSQQAGKDLKEELAAEARWVRWGCLSRRIGRSHAASGWIESLCACQAARQLRILRQLQCAQHHASKLLINSCNSGRNAVLALWHRWPANQTHRLFPRRCLVAGLPRPLPWLSTLRRRTTSACRQVVPHKPHVAGLNAQVGCCMRPCRTRLAAAWFVPAFSSGVSAPAVDA